MTWRTRARFPKCSPMASPVSPSAAAAAVLSRKRKRLGYFRFRDRTAARSPRRNHPSLSPATPKPAFFDKNFLKLERVRQSGAVGVERWFGDTEFSLTGTVRGGEAAASGCSLCQRLPWSHGPPRAAFQLPALNASAFCGSQGPRAGPRARGQLCSRGEAAAAPSAGAASCANTSVISSSPGATPCPFLSPAAESPESATEEQELAVSFFTEPPGRVELLPREEE